MKTFLSVLLAAAAATPAIAAPTSFAVDLYRLQAQDSSGNIVFSPYSINAAIALAGAGARGTTAAEIEKALRGPFSKNDINRAQQGLELTSANALWAAKDVEFHPEYLALARDKFAANVERVDFAHGDAARQRINTWVSEATRKKIAELIAPGVLSAASRLVLTNAIYMKAEWAQKFLPEVTNENGTFRTQAGEHKAALMRMTGHFRYLHSGAVRLLEMPYRGSELSMLVILPDDVEGLAKIEQSLTSEKLAKWESGLADALVAITFPRFKADLSMRLSEPLRAMGIHEAFTPKADFSGIAKEPLMISEVIHQAKIDVTEEGTEAAAATAVVMRAASAALQKPPKPEIFNADHPFLYLIRDNKTGNILFLGRLVQP